MFCVAILGLGEAIDGHDTEGGRPAGIDAGWLGGTRSESCVERGISVGSEGGDSTACESPRFAVLGDVEGSLPVVPEMARELLLGEAVSVVPEPTEASSVLTVALTYYVCENAPPGQSYCGTMASGKQVYEGAAACGDGLALGTRFRLAGKEYICEDRGAGPAYWVDIFFWDYYAGQAWRAGFGPSVEIEVER